MIKDLKITIEQDEKSDLSYKIHVKCSSLNMAVNMRFHPSPFGNCQNFSIANLESLLLFSNFKNQSLEIKKEIFLRVLYEIEEYVEKHILIVDIHQDYRESLWELLSDILLDDEEPIFTDYTSTNGSNMSIILIKIDLDDLRVVVEALS